MWLMCLLMMQKAKRLTLRFQSFLLLHFLSEAAAVIFSHFRRESLVCSSLLVVLANKFWCATTSLKNLL